MFHGSAFPGVDAARADAGRQRKSLQKTKRRGHRHVSPGFKPLAGISHREILEVTLARVYCLTAKVTFTCVPSASVPKVTTTVRLVALSSPLTMPPTFPSELLDIFDTANPPDFKASP